MDGEKLKYLIGANIAAYRKRSGLTQAGLAQKLNYSDKAVSKWERGESVPDVLTLANKNIILGLSSLLVWFVALFVYVVLSSLDIPNSWLAFFYAVPADAIVMLSLRSAWHDFRWNRVLISTIMWGVFLSIYMTLLILLSVNVWRIFLLGIPGQLAILLWFRMFRQSRNNETENGQEAAAQADSGKEAGDEPGGN